MAVRIAEGNEITAVLFVAVDLHVQTFGDALDLWVCLQHVVRLVKCIHAGLPITLPQYAVILHESEAIEVVGIEVLRHLSQKILQRFDGGVQAEPNPDTPDIAGQFDDREFITRRAPQKKCLRRGRG